jgi:hypothetical protein
MAPHTRFSMESSLNAFHHYTVNNLDHTHVMMLYGVYTMLLGISKAFQKCWLGSASYVYDPSNNVYVMVREIDISSITRNYCVMLQTLDHEDTRYEALSIAIWCCDMNFESWRYHLLFLVSRYTLLMSSLWMYAVLVSTILIVERN